MRKKKIKIGVKERVKVSQFDDYRGREKYQTPRFKSEEGKVLWLVKNKNRVGQNLRNAVEYNRIPWMRSSSTFRLRVEEYRRLRHALLAAPGMEAILSALEGCRIGKLSNLTFSPIVRCIREEQEYIELQQMFEDTSTEKLMWGTVIIKVLYGSDDEIVRDAKALVNRTRKALRKVHVRYARSYGQAIQFRCYAELEAYNWRQIQTAEACARQLLTEITEPLDLRGDIAGHSRRKEGEAILRKIRLLQKLGYDPGRKATAWVLHLHFLVNPVNATAYRAALRELYPGRYRVVLKKLYQGKTRDENLRFLAGYMLKVSARYGRLVSARGKTFLSGKLMRRFARIYSKLGYQGIKCHITIKRADPSMTN